MCVVVAPGAGVYHSGATSRAVGGTGGNALGLGVPSARVGSGVLLADMAFNSRTAVSSADGSSLCVSCKLWVGPRDCR